MTGAYASQVAQALERARIAEARAEQLVSEVAAVRCGFMQTLYDTTPLKLIGYCTVI